MFVFVTNLFEGVVVGRLPAAAVLLRSDHDRVRELDISVLLVEAVEIGVAVLQPPLVNQLVDLIGERHVFCFRPKKKGGGV